MSALLPQFLYTLIIVGFKPIYGQTCTTHSKTLPVALAAHEAIYSSHTKKAYIFGGDETESNIYKWDLSGAFQTIGSIPQSAVRFYTWSHNAVLIGNIIWFIGMRIKSSYETDLIFKYNVITEQWEDTSNLLAPPVSLSYGCLATDETHIFLVDGKSDNQARNPRVLQIYNIANNQWTTHATPYDDNGQYEWFYQYCHVVNNELFVLGGMLQYSNGDSTDLRDIFKYNRQLNQWTKLPVLLPNGWGSYHGKTVLYNDVLYMIGDIWVGNDAIKAFNTNTQTFDEITLRQDCDSPGIIVVDNVIYVFGGRGIGGQYLTNIEYCTLPTKEPTADPVPPTKKPSPPPTPAPTPAPTKRPSPQPTPAPNKQPTGIPTTAAPSPAPTVSPTTPSPTQPPPLPCGGETVGYYSSGQLVFEMTMTFTGDIIFDASNSNFAIAEIQALTALGNSLGSDSDGDGVVTLSQAIASDYKFVMVGEATGVYHVKIQCVSDSPTNDPTTPPVNHPITAHPTRRPSIGPFVSPVTSEPTTVSPSKRPTPLVTTKRPIATVTDTTEDSNDGREDEDGDTRVQAEDELSDVRIAVYILCGLVICCLCLCVVFVFYRYCPGDMIRKKTSDWGRAQEEIDHERHLVVQWLRYTVKLPQYTDMFLTNGFDNMRAIQAITSKEELARCGIEMSGHQTLILAEIYKARAVASNTVVNKPIIQMGEMGRWLENGEDRKNMHYEVNGEGVLIGHATKESWSDHRFDATTLGLTTLGLTHGTNEAANAPLVLDTPQQPPDEDAMTVEGHGMRVV